MKYILSFALVLLSVVALAQDKPYSGKFEAIDRLLEPPSPYRTASGAPGAEYWQQRANYKIKAEIDEANDLVKAEETITYFNNSPDALNLLWIQLEQNVNRKGNEDFGDITGGIRENINALSVQRLLRVDDFPAGVTISFVKDANGKAIPHIINNTMMRLNLEAPLLPGQSMTFSIGWSYHVTNRHEFRLSREGYEYFPDDDNKVYLLGHWFPRMAVYNDTEGWQNKQFMRLGEFALEFGDYEVEITVPSDHIVAGTGKLLNESDVLTSQQRDRMRTAEKSFDKPVMIITPDEAKKNERKKAKGKKTWKFRAENVRDVAFASSRKFIWDAQAVQLPTNKVMAMSYYPKEGLPTWTEESTLAVKNALEVYSEATFDYPYPVAISVNTSNIGMEFPMISFNGGRPVNGKMSNGAKDGMVGTIVHEVGHNWFPMIVSSDERKWMWMDEGLNTFLNERTMKERYPNFSNFRPKDIVPFMRGNGPTMRPIMTNSDNDLLAQMGNNFYRKPTVGLQILRETVIGEELFDLAFKEYANRWKYKHPNPSDLFRTLEDQSAVDLDWFWKGWFFTTDNVDIELSNVRWFRLKQEDTGIEGKVKKGSSTEIKGSGIPNNGKDFSGGAEEFTMSKASPGAYRQFLSRIDENAVRGKLADQHVYEITLKNRGGLVMPVIIQWNYADGTSEIETLPAEIWRLNELEVTKSFLKPKEVVSVILDPEQAVADVNARNNAFPRNAKSSAFDRFKKGGN